MKLMSFDIEISDLFELDKHEDMEKYASELIRDVSNNQKTMIITQNGEAKVILQDIKLYEQTQESLAFLKILAMSNKNLKDGNVKSSNQTFSDIRKRIKKDSK